MKLLQGIAATDNFAIGYAYLLDRRHIKVPQQHLTTEQVAGECERFYQAVKATDDELRRIRDKVGEVGGDTLILEAHRLIVSDQYLIARTVELIRERQINAEWALREAVKQIKQVFETVDNRYFRERRSDVDFGARHLLVTLIGEQPAVPSVAANAIIIAYELPPSELAQLHRQRVQGFVTQVGGQTSHTAIMARSLGMAAVVGVHEITAVVGNGDVLIVDGKRGEVIVDPDERTLNEYRRLGRKRSERMARLRAESALPAVTRDGMHVRLLANIGLPEELPLALEAGVDGVGLYRSDFLFLGRTSMPTEDEHYAATRHAMALCGELPIAFRTCDIGADKVPLSCALDLGPEANPAMGLRGIRLCLRRPEAFKAQLRGFLRAAQGGPLRIMFPMVSGLSELREAKALLYQCVDEVGGVPPSPLAIGMLVEMPSAALIAEQLAREVDFFAIGTNDLIQYTLGVDRVNDRVNHLYRPLHPAVLRLIRGIVDAGTRAGIDVSICGEMAGEPMLAPLLIGLGVRQLSMTPAAIPRVKRIIRALSVDDGASLAQRVLELPTAEEVEEELRQYVAEIFPEETLAGVFTAPGD